MHQQSIPQFKKEQRECTHPKCQNTTSFHCFGTNGEKRCIYNCNLFTDLKKSNTVQISDVKVLKKFGIDMYRYFCESIDTSVIQHYNLRNFG